MKELKIFIVDLDDIAEVEENPADIPIKDFIEYAKGKSLSIRDFALYVNEGDLDNLSNSYIRFAWVDENSIVEEKGKVISEK